MAENYTEVNYNDDKSILNPACKTKTGKELQPTDGPEGWACLACKEPDGKEIDFADLDPRFPRTGPPSSSSNSEKRAARKKRAEDDPRGADDGHGDDGDGSFEAKKERLQDMLSTLFEELESLYSKFDKRVQLKIYSEAVTARLTGIMSQLFGEDDAEELTEEILDSYIEDFDTRFKQVLTSNVTKLIEYIDDIGVDEYLKDSDDEGSTGGRKSMRFKKRKAKKSTRRKSFWFF